MPDRDLQISQKPKWRRKQLCDRMICLCTNRDKTISSTQVDLSYPRRFLASFAQGITKLEYWRLQILQRIGYCANYKNYVQMFCASRQGASIQWDLARALEVILCLDFAFFSGYEILKQLSRSINHLPLATAERQSQMRPKLYFFLLEPVTARNWECNNKVSGSEIPKQRSRISKVLLNFFSKEDSEKCLLYSLKVKRDLSWRQNVKTHSALRLGKCVSFTKWKFSSGSWDRPVT